MMNENTNSNHKFSVSGFSEDTPKTTEKVNNDTEPDFSSVLRHRNTASQAGNHRPAGRLNAPAYPEPESLRGNGEINGTAKKASAPRSNGQTRIIPAVPSEDTAAPMPKRSGAEAMRRRVENAPVAPKKTINWTAPSVAPKQDNRSKSALSSRRNTAPATPAQSAVRRHNGETAAKKHRRKKNQGEDDNEHTGMLNSVLKAIIYIMFVLVCSGFLSYFGITVCNDVFAFVKSNEEIEVEIPEYADIDDVRTILGENKVIQYPAIFKLYSQLRKDNGMFVAGVYTVTPAMNYDMLLKAFKAPVAERTELRISIPEGLTVDEMIDLFLENGIGTRDGFVDVINNFDFDFDFMPAVNEIWAEKSNPDSIYAYRKYRLEGYLFPDTYYFYSDSNEATVVYKMLVRFNQLFTQELRDKCTLLNYSMDQIVTLASMIQAEAKYEAEYKTISSVFWNRLNHPNYETQGRLESDATIQYILDERKIDLTDEDMNLDNPYNTYKAKGLPPSAICNPSYSAILRALYPDTTDYYYFVAQRNGYSLFATTYAEHVKNKLEALS